MRPLTFFYLPDNHMSDDDRFINIEIKLSDQENVVDNLNRTIYEQGRRIDQLEAMVAKLAEHVRTLRDAGQGPVNDRPPHY
jgi:SlyX protein